MEGIRKTIELSGDTFTARLQLREDYDIAGNNSVVTVTSMELKTSAWEGVVMYLDGEIQIGGKTVVSMSEFHGSHSVYIPAMHQYAQVTGNPAPPWRSQPIPHNSDGSGSTGITLKISGRSSGGGVRFHINGSEQMTLTTIPRVSQPSLSAGEARMGGEITVYTNRKSQSFTHGIRFRFGSYETSVSGVGDSYLWKIPDLAVYCADALSGQCQVTVSTYAGGLKLGEKTVGFSLRVPEAGTLSTPESISMGKSVEIGAGRNSQNFTTAVFFQFGRASGKIGEGKRDQYQWTPPLTLADQIPDRAAGTLKLRLETYNGSALVGTSRKEVTLTVPQTEETRPVIEEVAVSPTGKLPADMEGLFIRYKTGVAVTIRAKGQHSSIRSYAVTAEGKTYQAGDGSLKTDILNTAGEAAVTITVRDSRGFETSEKKPISVLSYETPAVVPYEGNNQIVALRASRDGTPSPSGGNLLVQAKRKYAKVISDGEQKNFCGIRYRVRATGAGFGSWKELLSQESDGDSVSITLPDAVPSPAVSYDVELQAVDAFGGSSPVSVHIPTDKVGLHIRQGGGGAAFGKYAEQDGTLESAWDLDMGGNRVRNLPDPRDPGDAVSLRAVFDRIYPVGCIYLSATDTDPSRLFGGVWQQIRDRFLLASGEKYAPGTEGGEEMHTLTVAEMPRHRHGILGRANAGDLPGRWGFISEQGQAMFAESKSDFAGSSQAHNNMPPYLAVYAWKRMQ